MLNEIAWTRKLCKEMRATGAVVVAYVGNVRQCAGFPDRIVISQIVGEIVLIEFKGEKTRITPAQMNFNFDSNRLAPGCCYLVRAPDVVTCDHQVERFDGTGLGLLQTIKAMRNDGKSK